MKTFKEYQEEQDLGTYVSVKFSSATNVNLKKYAEKLGLNPITDFHATIVYSPKALKDVVNSKKDISNMLSGTITGIKYLGEKDSEWRAIVLTIQSNTLDTLFKKYVDKYGYINPYDKYIRHISLAYSPPEGLDLSNIVLPKFKIEFKTEIITNLKEE